MEEALVGWRLKEEEEQMQVGSRSSGGSGSRGSLACSRLQVVFLGVRIMITVSWGVAVVNCRLGDPGGSMQRVGGKNLWGYSCCCCWCAPGWWAGGWMAT
jgi:hypothetical protein